MPSRPLRGGPAAVQRRYGAWRRLVNLAVLALAALIPSAGAAEAETLRVLMLGDSLTAGYGLPARDALPTQLEAALRERGYDVTVLNAGVSGDTTTGGLARLDWALADDPDIVIVALGANDGLRGLDPEQVEANLDAIISRLKDEGLRVLLMGMYAPPNLGQDYVRRFNAMFPALAKRHEVPLYPFLLEGVALDPRLNQSDGIHPNAEGVAVMVRGMLPYVAAVIDDERQARGDQRTEVPQ
jgi:acyl-CoA thioesterase-1